MDGTYYYIKDGGNEWGRLINHKELKDFDKNNIKKYLFSL